MFDYFNPNPYSQKEYSICRPRINFIRLGQISHVRTELKTPLSTAILKYHDPISPTKNPRPIKSQDDLFSNHARGIIFRAK
jgi:hypothetical protein